MLEPITPLNAGVLWRIMQSAQLREFQDVPRFTRDQFEKRVAARPKQFDGHAVGRFEWLVVPHESGVAIGWVSLRVGDLAGGVAELGYSILAAHRGRGFASEAATGIVDASFAHSDLRQVDAACVPANIPSRRLLARLGFGEARVQRNGAIVRGRPVDILIFEMTKARWAALR
ncbi:MAG TPA: GNAT family N-acetyltransferase, partial [Candidatus Baltobacteraceae bacterium]|nr:GNAT family N-acetyltransferase [Candidatus Baltobacteraceae bacterium]